MSDVMSPAARSALMARISGKNTGPELKVRRITHALGFRYRLHGSKLPGKPDLVFAGRRKVIFVHGCFWHRHPGCPMAATPKTRPEFWMEKLNKNVERDKRVVEELDEAGWKSLVIWECETADPEYVGRRIKEFLET